MFKRFIHKCTVPKLYCNNTHSFKYTPETPVHEILTRLNFVNHPKAGLVHWLPIGLVTLENLSKVIRNRMDEIGFEELGLSLLSHNSLWKTSGRWDQSSELFKLSGDEYILLPTAEEEITSYVANNISSYKNLPLLYYQVKTKFRNEKRPRGGLLRGKEFMMKDAYSFDIDEKLALQTYSSVVGAYEKMFQDIKVPYIKADADSGDIGGSLSHEWHIIHGSGEDLLFKCDGCQHVSNQEKTLSFPQGDLQPVQDVGVRYFQTIDKSTVICCYYPAQRILEPNFVKMEIDDIDLLETNQEQIMNDFKANESISKKIIRIMDSRLNSRSNFPDFPFEFTNRSGITTLTDIPIVLAEEGEICGLCEDGTLHQSAAIEIGHTFYLGDKYSSAFNCQVDIPNGNSIEKRNLIMGCYGIGLSRIIATIAEINRDTKGLSWPAIIAPWQFTIIEAANSNYDEFYGQLHDSKFHDKYRLDNRANVRLGRKVQDSGLMGIPLTIILGKSYPLIEIEVRGKRYVPAEDLAWKKLHSEIPWKVQYDSNGNDVKHHVELTHFNQIVDSLLKDM